MASAFTHYWQNNTWNWHIDQGYDGKPMNHLAGGQFEGRGVHVGDRIYGVTNIKGEMYLLGRMTADKFCDQQEAERELNEDLWDADEHVVSYHSTTMDFHRPVPDEIVRQLRFGDDKPLEYNAAGILDTQTLRGVRRLTPASAELLDDLIDAEDTPEASEKPDLKLVKTVEELADNFRMFQREARRYPSRTAIILRSTWYWVRDANSGAFGPGKFLGYRGMDFGIYEEAGKGRDHYDGDKFDGGLSQNAIRKVVSVPFAEDREMVARLRKWGERTFGAGAFGGASSSKWKFLTFAIPGRELLTDYPDEITQPETFFEGATRTVSVNVYERDRRARAACITHYGTACSVCGLDFVERYGDIGEDFTHVHHLKPLSEIGEAYRVDPVRDLRPVCPNCHAMLHRKTPPLTIEALRGMIRE